MAPGPGQRDELEHRVLVLLCNWGSELLSTTPLQIWVRAEAIPHSDRSGAQTKTFVSLTRHLKPCSFLTPYVEGKGNPRWESAYPWSSLQGYRLGTKCVEGTLRKRSVPGGACCRLVVGVHPSGLSPQKLPCPLHLPSLPPCPGSRPSSFSVPHPETPSFSNLLWPSGLGHISLCHDGNMCSTPGSCSLYTRLPIRILTLRAPSKNPVSSPHANCQQGEGTGITSKMLGKFWVVYSSFFLYCGPCLHHLLPYSGLVASVSSCQGGKGHFQLCLGTVRDHPCPGSKRMGLQWRLSEIHTREIFLSVELDLVLLLPSPSRKRSTLLRL